MARNDAGQSIDGSMPNTDSAKRALRKAERRRLRNRPQRSALRTMVKKVRTLATAGDLDGAKTALATVIKRLDQAADKHLAGAALTSFMKKCQSDAQKTCAADASAKKLSGAAKNSHMKKCVDDAVGT